LHDGKILKNAIISDCIDSYLNLNRSSDGKISESITYCHPDIKITKITVNESEANSIHVTSITNKVKFAFNGILCKSIRMAAEVRIYDHRDMPLAIFSPSHKSGLVPLMPQGHFNIECEMELPANMNKGIYFADIFLTFPNETFWLIIRKGLAIETDGVPNTGMTFKYADEGWLFL